MRASLQRCRSRIQPSALIRLLLRPTQTARAKRAIVQTMQPPGHTRPQQRMMSNGKKVLRDKPKMFSRGHPIKTIKTRQINWSRKSPQRPLPPKIEVNIEVTQGKFAQSAIHRLAVAASGVVRLGDRPPVASAAVNRDHVIGIVLGFEIEDQRRISVSPQRSGRQSRALEAMRGVFS